MIFFDKEHQIVSTFEQCCSYFPKDIFLRATSQMSNFLKVSLSLLRLLRLQWGQSAAARVGLRSCHLRYCTIGKLLHGKIPLGNCCLGKYLWESALHPLNISDAHNYEN